MTTPFVGAALVGGGDPEPTSTSATTPGPLDAVGATGLGFGMLGGDSSADDGLIGGAAVALAGTAVGTSTASGDLQLEHSVAGSTSGDSAAHGALLLARGLAGEAAGSSSTSGALAVEHEGQVGLAGQSDGVSTATGALSLGGGLAGTAVGHATATAELVVIPDSPAGLVQLVGASAGVSTASAMDLSIRRRRIGLVQRVAPGQREMVRVDFI